MIPHFIEHPGCQLSSDAVFIVAKNHLKFVRNQLNIFEYQKSSVYLNQE